MANIYGTSGDDTLDGAAGNDALYGYAGNDSIIGSLGNDSLYGYAGNDTLSGGDGDDYLSKYNETGDGLLLGGNGNDTIYGGLGNDTLDGGAGNDALYGYGGNDTLDGGTGVDTLWGGAGDDVYYIDNLLDSIDDTDGNDTAYVSTSFVKLPSTIENVIYTNGALALPYWIDALLADSAALYRPATLLGSAKTFGYIFPTILPDYERFEGDANGYMPFSSGQIARTEVALRYIESLIDVRFVRTENAAAKNVLTFGNNLQTDSAGYAFMPSDEFFASDIFINTDEALVGETTFADGTYGALTLIHEIGHAIGLKHPFSQENNNPPYLPSSDDDTAWTVMSYTSHSAQYYLQYSPLDIATLQYLYGVSSSARASNDTHTVYSTTANFIWDGAGTDVIDASNLGQGVTIYLTSGYWGYVGSAKASTITAAGQITVNFGTVIENLIGTGISDSLYGNEVGNQISGGNGDDRIEGWDGDDSLIGGAGNDTLNGGGGNDSIDAGVGTDLANYTASTAGISVNLSANAQATRLLLSGSTYQNDEWTVSIDGVGSVTYVVQPSDEEGSNIVNMATHWADAINASVLSSILTATVESVDGKTTILLEENGAGRGFDYSASVVDATSSDNSQNYPLSVEFKTRVYPGQMQSGNESDLLQSIENIIGTSFDDNISGSTVANSLTGGDGADSITGLGGNDALTGGNGADTLAGGAGDDSLDGGLGDDLALFSGVQSAYRFAFDGNTLIVSGQDGTDRLTDIESLRFGGEAPVAVSSLQSSGQVDELITIQNGGVTTRVLPDLYSGPVTWIRYQMLGGGTSDVAIGTSQNDFFNLLGGDDAANGSAGDDVIDGGIGSNFLSGGAGRDDFFLDGRGGTTTWATITDWEAGERLSVWGWRPGVSTAQWVANAGAPGWTGVTMHGDLDGNGVIDTSVTWTGFAQSALPTPLEFEGLLWFT